MKRRSFILYICVSNQQRSKYRSVFFNIHLTCCDFLVTSGGLRRNYSSSDWWITDVVVLQRFLFVCSFVLFFLFLFLSCKLADMLYSFQTFKKEKSCIVYTSWKYDPLLARCTFSFFSQSRLFLFFSFKCFHSESFLSPQLCGPAVH